MSICLFVCLSACVDLSVCVCLSVCVYFCLYVFLSMCIFVCVCLSVIVHICVCVYPTMCISVRINVCLCVSICYDRLYVTFLSTCLSNKDSAAMFPTQRHKTNAACMTNFLLIFQVSSKEGGLHPHHPHLPHLAPDEDVLECVAVGGGED